jgi:5-methylcytosine-specific restriction endonuclease McrA
MSKKLSLRQTPNHVIALLLFGSDEAIRDRFRRPRGQMRPVNSAAFRRREREKESGDGFTEASFVALKEQYGDVCLACRKSAVLIVPDHVIPMCRGGKHSIENIQPLCLACNFRKGIQIIDYR